MAVISMKMRKWEGTPAPSPPRTTSLRGFLKSIKALASPPRSLAALTGMVAMLPPRGDASRAPAERTCELWAAAASPGDLGPSCSVS